MTTKRVHLKSVVDALLWFLVVTSNVSLAPGAGRIDVGRVGVVTGDWVPSRHAVAVLADTLRGYVEQIAGIMRPDARDPDSRRLMVSAWNVSDLPEMALAPCHPLFQFYVFGRSTGI